MALSISFLFSAINLQTATKDELMCIKGIGEKKAMAIITHRKSNKINSVDDLIELKGFGKGIITSIKKEIKTVKCGGKKTTPKKSTSKKSTPKKTEKKTTDNSKKIESKKVEKTTKKDKEEKPKKEKKENQSGNDLHSQSRQDKYYRRWEA